MACPWQSTRLFIHMNNYQTYLHSTSSLDISQGGLPRSVSLLAEHLGKVACKQIVMAYDSTQEKLLPTGPNVQTILLPAQNLWPLNFAYCPTLKMVMKNLCKDTKISLIHSHGLWTHSNYTASRVANSTDVPLIISPLGMLAPWALQYKYLKKRVGWYAYQRKALMAAKAIHATSQNEAINIRDLGLKQPIAVIPNGVNVPKIFKHECAEGNYVLFLSRVHPGKGIELLIRAWAKIKPCNISLIIAGNGKGKYLDSLKSLAHDLGIQKTVQFLGHVNDDAKWDLYKSAQCFVLPSMSESFGIAIAEALAVGTPVITTTNTPWKDIEDYNCGWRIDLTVDNLVLALLEVISMTPSDRSRIGLNGRSLVENKYNWTHISNVMTQFYNWVEGISQMPDFVML